MVPYRKTALNGVVACGTTLSQHQTRLADWIGPGLLGKLRPRGRLLPTTRTPQPLAWSRTPRGIAQILPRARGGYTYRPAASAKQRHGNPSIEGTPSHLGRRFRRCAAMKHRVRVGSLPVAAGTTNCEPLSSRSARPRSITEFHVRRWFCVPRLLMVERVAHSWRRLFVVAMHRPGTNSAGSFTNDGLGNCLYATRIVA